MGEKFKLVTAFITAFGIFMWKRIPMWTQPAASYFQYCMMVIVLAGLAYGICEAYIDDLIVINAIQPRSFLDLAQYFARHVENYVQWAEPMRAVLNDKSRKWLWSQAAEVGFLGVQDAIRLCPKLYFVSDEPAHKIYLRTDASQYGYGAYLFQEKDGEEWPIHLIP